MSPALECDYRFCFVALLSSGPRGFKCYRSFILLLLLLSTGCITLNDSRLNLSEFYPNEFLGFLECFIIYEYISRLITYEAEAVYNHIRLIHTYSHNNICQLYLQLDFSQNYFLVVFSSWDSDNSNSFSTFGYKCSDVACPHYVECTELGI